MHISRDSAGCIQITLETLYNSIKKTYKNDFKVDCIIYTNIL